jgi:hypothetical protein
MVRAAPAARVNYVIRVLNYSVVYPVRLARDYWLGGKTLSCQCPGIIPGPLETLFPMPRLLTCLLALEREGPPIEGTVFEGVFILGLPRTSTGMLCDGDVL